MVPIPLNAKDVPVIDVDHVGVGRLLDNPPTHTRPGKGPDHVHHVGRAGHPEARVHRVGLQRDQEQVLATAGPDGAGGGGLQGKHVPLGYGRPSRDGERG